VAAGADQELPAAASRGVAAELPSTASVSTRIGMASVIFAALAVLPPIASALGDPYLLVMATRIMIFAMAALSLDLILGFGGMVSFGHAAFIGIGAYTVGILASHGIGDFLLQAPVAIAVSTLFALITGAISLRTRGVYFIMITLAFGQMAFFFMVSLSAYGGDDGLTLASRSTIAGLRMLDSNLAFYYAVFALLLGFFLLARTIIASRFGRVLRGIHDNPDRMRAIGFSPLRYQLVAYCLAGAMAGIAGTLLVNQNEFAAPAYMSWQRSGDLIFMVVLGGMGTLIGPIAGAAGLMVLEEVLAKFSEHWKLGLGVILILIVLNTRGGIAGMIERIAGRSETGDDRHG
jgi:branched-chain amino acid transport system permease protein